MNKSLEQWQYPIGRFKRNQPSEQEIKAAIEELKHFPQHLRQTLSQLNEEEYDEPYRPGGWTIRQLVHHIADSHLHAYTRCKFAFLEEQPQIKSYQEKDWAEKTTDGKTAPIASSVKIIEGIHQRWVCFFEALTSLEFQHSYLHPERLDVPFTLAEVCSLYAWHSKHHLAHIRNSNTANKG